MSEEFEIPKDTSSATVTDGRDIFWVTKRHRGRTTSVAIISIVYGVERSRYGLLCVTGPY